MPGIKLMPRIRNWKDLTFFRPGRDVHYRHIDALFTDDWELIETHWQDLLQVVLNDTSCVTQNARSHRRTTEDGSLRGPDLRGLFSVL